MPNLIKPQFRLAEYVRSTWSATPQAGTSPEEILKPEFWAHVAPELKAGDHIEVSPESGEWLVELLVRATGAAGIVVHPLHVHNFTAPDLPESKDYEVKFGGSTAKWRVIRRADRHVVVEGLPTREAAEAWLANNSKTDLV